MGDRSIFSQASRKACMDALADMQSIGIDIRFDPDACPIYQFRKPPGCYITCNENGEKVGYFNENAWNNVEFNLENRGHPHDAEPLCVASDLRQPDLNWSLTAQDGKKKKGKRGKEGEGNKDSNNSQERKKKKRERKEGEENEKKKKGEKREE